MLNPDRSALIASATPLESSTVFNTRRRTELRYAESRRASRRRRDSNAAPIAARKPSLATAPADLQTNDISTGLSQISSSRTLQYDADA